MPSKVWDETTYLILDFNGRIMEVWAWISYFILHYMINVITYPCWNYIQSIIVNGATAAKHNRRSKGRVVCIFIGMHCISVILAMITVKHLMHVAPNLKP